MRFLVSTFVLLFFIFSAYGQSKSDPPTSKGDDFSKKYEGINFGDNSRSKKEKLKSSPIMQYYDQKIEEYRERMKKNAKKYRKMSKKMRKKQYSDPTYFGHKRPPKKRKPGKKKYCKVCNMVH